MISYNEFMGNDNGLSLPKLKRNIRTACDLNSSTHKTVSMGNHAGINLSYGNGVSSDGFKVRRIDSENFKVEVHNNNQAILTKIESYLKTTGYTISRNAFNIKVSTKKL
ncbi:hypothetical protein GD1_49 [Paraglaciecola Antarctic GD virus 1]|nr:hypothetical protein GD1_49 [Paraglaciecola Antarctic GD virus 1]